MKDLGNSFIWWFGEVKDIDDPLKIGRVRVLVYSFYDPNTSTSDLPWAVPLNPITSASKDQIGTSPTGLLVGSMVFGFFLDGDDAQRPAVMGTIGGIPGLEPDTSRLARGDSDYIPTNPGTKDASATTNILTASSGSWSEILSAYGAVYPKNHVRQTESGHIQEFDDTPGAERIHEYHKAGTFYEIDKDGNKVTRVVGDKYEIVAGDEYVNIKGTCYLTIDTDCEVYVKGDYTLKVDGDKREIIGGNSSDDVAGTLELDSGGNYRVTSPRIDLNP